MKVDQLIAASQSLSDENQANVANTFQTVKKEPTEMKTNSNIVTMLNNPRISFFSVNLEVRVMSVMISGDWRFKVCRKMKLSLMQYFYLISIDHCVAKQVK